MTSSAIIVRSCISDNYSRLVEIARRIGRGRIDPREAVAEACIKALRYVERWIDDGRGPLPWLIRLVQRAVWAVSRRVHGRASVHVPVDERTMTGEGRSPEEWAMVGQRLGRARAVVAGLDVQWRAIYQARYVEGLDHGEVAARVGCAPGTSMSASARIGERILRALGE